MIGSTRYLLTLATLYAAFWALFTPANYDGHLLIIGGLYGAAVGTWLRENRRA